MKLTANQVSLAISLSLALSSGTAFALPFLKDGDGDAATYLGRQVADPLQFGMGRRGVQSLEAMPIEASLLNGPTKRFDDLKRSTGQAPTKPPVWVPMDPEREELGPGEAPRPKKPRHGKKKSAHPKKSNKESNKSSGKGAKQSAKQSRLERKVLQHQRALLEQEKPVSKGSKAGNPSKSSSKGSTKNSHRGANHSPLPKSSHNVAAGKPEPPGKGEHRPPHKVAHDPFGVSKVQSPGPEMPAFAAGSAVQRSLDDETEQAFERDEQDDQMDNPSQAPEQGEPKGDEEKNDQSKGPQPTLADMLLPIKRSLWSSPSADVIVYDRDIDDQIEEARDDDDGNVFWDRDIDDVASRDVKLSDEEFEDARDLLADLDTFEDARDMLATELFAARPPTIGKRGEIDEAIESAWARAAVDDDITARDWRVAAQKAIDCSVDPAGCALKYGLSYTGLEPSEGQRATFDKLRAATQKARECGTNPMGCAMDHSLSFVGLEPPPGRRSAADEGFAA